MQAEVMTLRLFNLESKFYRFMTRVGDCILLSLLWIVFSLPIVTCGAASSALYYAMHKALHDLGEGTVKEFWRGFKMNWKQATLVWLLNVALITFVVGDLFLIYRTQGTSGVVFKAFAVFAIVVVTWTLFWFPYLARFEDRIGTVLKNSFIFLTMNLGSAVLLLADFAAAVALTGFLYYIPLVPLFVPAVYAMCANLVLEKVFAKYMTNEEEEPQSELSQEKSENA